MKLIIQLFIVSLFANSINAATITAATTSRADVLIAVNAAASGDTVNIPTGTSTWASPIALTKAITLNGNGTNNTIIQNSQSPGTSYDNSLVNINLTVAEKDKVITIQNIKFVATANPTSGGTVGISSDGATTWPTQVRITQCFFTKFNFAIVPKWFGVCDHCEFYNVRDCVRWPCVSLAALPSAPPFAWNSGNWFFAEDCDFVQDAGQNAYQYINMDSEGPSCQAVRYSRYKLTISGSFYQLFDMHGSGNCGGQSSVGILSYKNVVTCNVGDTIQFADIRGGTGSLCYSNTCNGSAYVTIRTDPAGSAAPVNTHDWSNTDKTGIIDGTTLPAGFAQYTYPHPLVAAAPDPVISVQPANTTVISGANASFSVTASGGSALHYQWRKNGSNVGSDSSSFTFATINTDNQAAILVTVTDSAGSLDSSTVTLTVITNAIPFVNPTTIAYGLNPTNTVTNSSFVISNAGGGTLSGNATISAPYSVTSGGSYSLTAGQSQTITITYTPTLNQTDNGIVNLTGGGSTNVVTSGSGYYVYSPGIIPMAGVTLFSPMQINVQGSIFQTVTTAASSGGRAIVGLNLSSPTTITISGNVIATNTSNNTLAIDIDSDPTATTQEWSITNLTANVLSPRVVSKRGTGSGTIPQFSTNTWSLASGLHLIELRGIEANTFVNQLTINATNDPAITVQPVNQTVTAGGNATFTVTATGNSTLHYQWIFNGLNVGSDSSSYTRNNCQLADNGGTMVVNVSDASGSVNSQNATLTVNTQILNSGITIQGKFKVTGKAKLNQ